MIRQYGSCVAQTSHQIPDAELAVHIMRPLAALSRCHITHDAAGAASVAVAAPDGTVTALQQAQKQWQAALQTALALVLRPPDSSSVVSGCVCAQQSCRPALLAVAALCGCVRDRMHKCAARQQEHERSSCSRRAGICCSALCLPAGHSLRCTSAREQRRQPGSQGRQQLQRQHCSPPAQRHIPLRGHCGCHAAPRCRSASQHGCRTTR